MGGSLCTSPKVNDSKKSYQIILTTHQSKQLKDQKLRIDFNESIQTLQKKQDKISEISEYLSQIHQSPKQIQAYQQIQLQYIKNSGLPNLGNTCFLNSIIQFLFSAQKFTQKVISFKDKPSKIHQILREIFLTLKKDSDRHQKETALKKLINYLRRIQEIDYEKSSQQDSLRFLTIILNHLTKEQPEIMNLFLLQYLMKCHNQKCAKQYLKFKDYSFSVSQQCCHQCQSLRQMLLLNQPQYIMILGNDKDKKFTVKKRDDTELQYKLVSQIYYSGNGQFGHYIATRLVNIDNKFYYFNDSYVSEANDNLSRFYKVKVSLYSLNRLSQSDVINQNIKPIKRTFRKRQKAKQNPIYQIYQKQQLLNEQQFKEFKQQNKQNKFQPKKNELYPSFPKGNNISNSYQSREQKLSKKYANNQIQLRFIHNNNTKFEVVSKQEEAISQKMEGNIKEKVNLSINKEYFTVIESNDQQCPIIIFTRNKRNQIKIQRVILDPNRLYQINYNSLQEELFSNFDSKIRQFLRNEYFKVFIQPSHTFSEFNVYRKRPEILLLSFSQIKDNHFFNSKKIYQMIIKTSRLEQKIIFELSKINYNYNEFSFYWLNRNRNITQEIIYTLQQKYKTEPICVKFEDFSQNNKRKLTKMIEDNSNATK